jgi:hypothetical protein
MSRIPTPVPSIHELQTSSTIHHSNPISTTSTLAPSDSTRLSDEKDVGGDAKADEGTSTVKGVELQDQAARLPFARIMMVYVGIGESTGNSSL